MCIRLNSSRVPRRSVDAGLVARFDRNLLYEESWSPQPMWKLAPKDNVSDVALAKKCRKLKIPLPGRGYWAKLAAGKFFRGRPARPPFLTPDRTSNRVEAQYIKGP